MKDLFNNKIYLLNLIIIVLAWSASSSCFYIIGFYVKYIPGDAFMNIIVTSIADAISSIAAGSISQAIGAKNTLFMSFSLATFGAIALMFSGTNKYLIVIFVLISRFGINSAFTLCYIITADYFPSIVTSRVFGLCSVFSRMATILSPMIAEFEPPVPMIIYSIVCTITMISSLGLTKSEEITDAMKDIDDSLSFHS
jgi:MFS family permease